MPPARRTASASRLMFVTILVIYSGFKGVEVNQIKLARTFGASEAQILTNVILPGSIPTMIAALKVNAGFAGGGRRRRVSVGQRRPWLPHSVRQPDIPA